MTDRQIHNLTIKKIIDRAASNNDKYRIKWKIKYHTR